MSFNLPGPLGGFQDLANLAGAMLKLMNQKYLNFSSVNYEIKSDRWDKNMAYGFGVWDVDPETNTYKSGSSAGVDPSNPWNGLFTWKNFDLPINPSNISMSIPFAINTIATSRGVLEEHNGVVFRNISISGTTGVAAGKRRGGYMKEGGIGGFLKSAISVGVSAASSAMNAVTSFGGLLSGGKPNYPKLISAINTDDYGNLGYTKLHELLNYFVAYAEMKKRGYAPNARLVFYNKKDNVTYVVTPVSFDVSKSADSPHIYNYKISLKAWALAEGNLDDKTRSTWDFSAAGPSALTRMMNVLRGARSVLSSASAAVRAVASDFETVMGIAGEAMLVVKEAGGFYKTCADFPELMANQWNHIARSFEQKANDIKDSFAGAPDPVSQPHTDRIKKATEKSISQLTGAATTRVGSDPGNASPPADPTTPLSSSESTTENADLLDQYSLDELSLSPAEQAAIDAKIARAKALTINDWDVRRRKLEEVRDAFADSRQLSDASYDAAARRPTIAGTSRAPTLEDYVTLAAFNDIISVIDGLSATNDLIKSSMPDPFARAREIVGDSGITVTSVVSAFAVPFPYGGSLETLAATYLNDPDRWLDIAILNNLKSPFIDETGFIYNFTTSGNKNSFTISDKTNLYPNQEIFLSSLTKRKEKRRIVKIDELGVANFLVTVDGDADLSGFTAVQQAKMQAYLPNTVNSGMVILIPGAPTGDEGGSGGLPDTRDIPATMNLNQQQKIMGVDIALTENFDLAVKSDGDVAVAVGLANAMQAIRLKLATEKGQLKRHQDYGSGLPIGQKLDMTAQDIKSLVEKAIMSDPRFVDVPDISVQFDGGTVSLNITVSLANEGGVIPISFQL